MNLIETQTEIVNEIKLDFAALQLQSDGILRIYLHDDCVLNRENVSLLHDTYKQICGEQKYLFLFEAGENVVYTKDGREFSKKHEHTQPSVKIAAVSQSLPYRMIVNFYLNFYKPAKPVRFFSNYEKAVDWLLEEEKERKEM